MQTLGRWRSCSLVLLLVVVTTGIRLVLAPVLGDPFPYLVYLPAVALAGSLCRLGSSILCLSLSAVAADYFFVPGRGVFLNADPASRVGLGLFIVTSIPIIVAFYWYHIKFDRFARS